MFSLQTYFIFSMALASSFAYQQLQQLQQQQHQQQQWMPYNTNLESYLQQHDQQEDNCLPGDGICKTV
ncbi:jg2033 [Pararge aegeria aegeria]|uniref:Jg2033 protein n=1 Tax=Pararge aegeria aegeria TaxID=348720 RepID=A0A8S4R420_9NEOP|nr:jg2033 [Pararge aegeria aegeria]